MRFGTGSLLESRRIFHSRDVDETRAWLGGKEYGTRFEDLDRYFFAFALLARTSE